MRPAMFGVWILAASLLASPVFAEVSLFQRNALLEAADRGDAETTRRLVLETATVDVEDDLGRTPLSLAAKRGSIPVVRLLLEARAAPDSADETGATPLFWASDRGHDGIVGLLLDHGAAVDWENDQGITPLMAAARSGHLAAVRRLLQAGADPTLLDFTGRSARDWADVGRNRQVVQEIANAGG